jgi:hypothetical protein
MSDTATPEKKALYHRVLGKRMFTQEHAARIMELTPPNRGGWSETEIKEDEPDDAGATGSVVKKADQDAVDSNAGKGNSKGKKAGPTKAADPSE